MSAEETFGMSCWQHPSQVCRELTLALLGIPAPAHMRRGCASPPPPHGLAMTGALFPFGFLLFFMGKEEGPPGPGPSVADSSSPAGQDLANLETSSCKKL